MKQPQQRFLAPCTCVRVTCSSSSRSVQHDDAASAAAAAHHAQDEAVDARQQQREQRKELRRQSWWRCPFTRLHGWISSSVKSLIPLLRADPWIWVIPLLVLVVLLAVGLWAPYSAADSAAKSTLQTVTFVAERTAGAIQTQLIDAIGPSQTLAIFVRQNPYFPTLNASFNSVAASIFGYHNGSDTVSVLELAPNGIISAVSPMRGNENALGLDLFDKRPAYCQLAVKSGLTTVGGPLPLVQGYIGLFILTPVFVKGFGPNETFGGPLGGQTSAAQCPKCYNATTGSKLWGFTLVLMNWEVLINDATRLPLLESQGYNYELWAPSENSSTPDNLVARSGEDLGDSPVERLFNVPNAKWLIKVSSSTGLRPPWRTPVLVVVVFGSFTFACMAFAILVSRRLQRMALETTQATNALYAESNRQLEDANRLLADTTATLEAEKLATEALIKRQLRLIECLGGADTSSMSPTSGNSRTTVEDNGAENTQGAMECLVRSVRDRIKFQRLALTNRSSMSGQEPSASSDSSGICLSELLGEGTFGKVYRGVWNGTEVAIKSILLPANMSGQAKREKMAVMEAAISSSLSHPNIVQTFTYDIQPIKDNSASSPPSSTVQCSGAATSPAILLMRGSSTNPPLGAGGKGKGEGEGEGTMRGSSVRSYEVRIILEFCDKGTLRDALDASIFMASTGYNYNGALDTALDVARAIVHLHRANVLHGDLKCLNVLLKSSGAEGRGFVAKVADFGLSVQIDMMQTHMSNMFQGTTTHMAPEVLLKGQVGRAADVYAFGITLWEIITGSIPFKDTPVVSLGHQVAVNGLRPSWPQFTPVKYRELAERCWAQDPEDRPTMEDIVLALSELRKEQGGPTPAVDLSYHQEFVQRKREKMREAQRSLEAMGDALSSSSIRMRPGIGRGSLSSNGGAGPNSRPHHSHSSPGMAPKPRLAHPPLSCSGRSSFQALTSGALLVGSGPLGSSSSESGGAGGGAGGGGAGAPGAAASGPALVASYQLGLPLTTCPEEPAASGELLAGAGSG